MNSKLQIISGTYRGRKLFLPDGARPTQNLARGAIFNILMPELRMENLFVWDAFAGSGALGLEVLSRIPSATAVFTDTSVESLNALRKNIIPFNCRANIVNMDAFVAIKKYGGMADLVFVDPPYANPELGIDFVAKLAKGAHRGTIVVQEIESNVPYSPDETKWDILRDKKYGRARFLILRRKSK